MRSRERWRAAVTKRNLRPLGRPHNLVHGGGEVGHDGRAEDARLRDVRAPRARLHQDAAAPEGTRRLDVAWAVAHERRAPEVDPQRVLRLAQRPSPRLAALTGPGDLGVVRAEVCGVDPRAVRGEQLAEALLHGVVSRHIVQPARDPRLVAPRDDEEARGVEPPDRLTRPGEQPGAPGLVPEAWVLENRAVPVEEDRPSHRAL